MTHNLQPHFTFILRPRLPNPYHAAPLHIHGVFVQKDLDNLSPSEPGSAA
jgi:hypothetical protein